MLLYASLRNSWLIKNLHISLHVILMVGVSIFSLMAAQADEKRIPDAYDLSRLSYSPLVKRTANMVVGITAQKIISPSRPSLASGNFFQQFLGRNLLDGPGSEETLNHSLGSGVVVHPEGLVVTSYHVIEGADHIQVRFNDRRIFSADVHMSDPSTDIAILKIQSTKHGPFPSMPIGDSDLLEIGDLVIAIGNPYRFGQTVTSGIISALSRPLPQFSAYSSFIQTDAGINPGNSGGALINTKGQLIGINTAIFSSSGGYQGIGFAIPSRIITRAIDAAIKQQPFLKPWTGVIGEDITPGNMGTYKLERPAGVLVRQVIKNSPAFHANIQPLDIVLSIDGKFVDDVGYFTHRVATHLAGQTLSITLLRNHQIVHTQFVTALPPLDPPPQYWHGEHYLRGATFSNISPAIAQQLSLPEYYQGVAVIALTEESPAASVGLKRGDMLVHINQHGIANTIKLKNTVHHFPNGRIFIEYIRNKTPRRVIIDVP